MEHLLQALETLPENIDSIKEALSAFLAAFIVLVGTVFSAFTVVAGAWDKIFGADKGGNAIKQIGAFLRRWSLLKDEKEVPTEPLIETDPEKK